MVFKNNIYIAFLIFCAFIFIITLFDFLGVFGSEVALWDYFIFKVSFGILLVSSFTFVLVSDYFFYKVDVSSDYITIYRPLGSSVVGLRKIDSVEFGWFVIRLKIRKSIDESLLCSPSDLLRIKKALESVL